MVAPCRRSGCVPDPSFDLSHDLDHAPSFSTRSHLGEDSVLLDGKLVWLNLPRLVKFKCLNISELFVNYSELILCLFCSVFSFRSWENFVFAAVR